MSNQKHQETDPLEKQNNEYKILTFYGSKLFVKFFTWFCALTLITLSLTSAYGYLYHYMPARVELANIAAEILQDNGQIMVDSYEREGLSSLNKFRNPGCSWLYDEKLTNLLQESFAEGDQNNTSKYFNKNHGFSYIKEYENFYRIHEKKIRDFARELFEESRVNTLSIDREVFVGCKFLSDTNKRYVVIVHVPKKRSRIQNEYTFSHAIEVLPIFALICVILCYSTARYVSKPIEELQRASQRFAKGDFSCRVSKLLRKRNDEFGALADDFNNMAGRIERGINNQKRLFHDISHELRSPLARMQVSLELLQLKASTSQKSLIIRMEKEVNRLNALICELLQFSKIESQNEDIIKQEVYIGQALENVCNDANFESKTTNKSIKLTVVNECLVEGNSALIERAFENIIRNALKYTADGTSVDVVLEKVENKARVQITDHGPGVPEDKIGNLFTPFFTVSQERNPQKGGIGLGLAIALRAISINNGTVKMENNPEGGLRATIELPLKA